MPEQQSDSQAVFQDFVQDSQNAHRAPPISKFQRANRMAQARGWNEPYPGIRAIQSRLEVLANGSGPVSPSSRDTQTNPDPASALPVDQIECRPAPMGRDYPNNDPGESDRRERVKVILNRRANRITGGSELDVLRARNDSLNEQRRGGQSTSPPEPSSQPNIQQDDIIDRTESQSRGPSAQKAQQWLQSFGQLDPQSEEYPGESLDRIGILLKEMEKIPENDKQTQERYLVALKNAENILRRNGWDVTGQEWLKADKHTIETSQGGFVLDRGDVIPDDARVVEVTHVGLYPTSEGGSIYGATLKFCTPEGKYIYTTIMPQWYVDQRANKPTPTYPPLHPDWDTDQDWPSPFTGGIKYARNAIEGVIRRLGK